MADKPLEVPEPKPGVPAAPLAGGPEIPRMYPRDRELRSSGWSGAEQPIPGS